MGLQLPAPDALDLATRDVGFNQTVLQNWDFFATHRAMYGFHLSYTPAIQINVVGGIRTRSEITLYGF